MARFEDRPLRWTDILGRFEKHSHQEHVQNALGMIGALQDHGRTLWPDESPQLIRWDKGCTELWSFLNELGGRRDIQKQDLPTTMREFIHEFEHTTERMHQMLYGETADVENDQKAAEAFDWFNLIFRYSLYGLLSGWIEDKQDHYLLRVHSNRATGATSRELTGTAMKVPKKYRRATKRL